MNQKNRGYKILALIAGLAILPALAGCGVQDRTPNWETGAGGQTRETATQTQGEGGGQTGVSYEIPQGWQWTDIQRKDAIRADEGPVNDEGPFTKLELLGITGGAADAKSAAREMYEVYADDCESQGEECAAPPEYHELDIAGVTVYCAISGSKAFSPAISWSSYVAFAKNGKTVGFMLYDRADLQRDLLEKVVTTITW